MRLIEATKNQTEYTIPNGVKCIASNSFPDECSIKAIVFPDSLETIEGKAFNDFQSLKEVYLPASITSIGKYAFNPENTAIIVEPDSYAEQYARDNHFTYTYSTSSTDWLN